VPGISAEEFATFAEEAKTACPVSAALTGTTITLDAALT
jgi:lipoyl-dependent peroxiredoxin